jgi:SAM-dependent methyltransferase
MPDRGPFIDRAKLSDLLDGDDRPLEERRRLIRLMDLFAGLSEPPGGDRRFPRFAELKEAFVEAAAGTDGEALEEAFLELYAHLHMHEAPYTPGERRRVDATGGYWSHAGGLSPILRAGPWIQPGTRSVDLGAGNGLQGLLMQKLDPHLVSCQIEISSAMIEIGRDLQGWLGIPEDRVEWRAHDVLETALGGWDFVYLYRPVRPVGPGHDFYTRLAATLAAEDHEVVVFSVADCLGDFLPESFDRFFSDGHLTCFRKRR